MSDLKKYEGVIPAFTPAMMTKEKLARAGTCAGRIFYRERCAGLVCQRILWRMYLPERGRSQADSRRSDGSS